jgi:hypothetical protein
MAVPLTVFELEALPADDREGETVDPPGLIGPAVLLQPSPGESFDAMELLAVDRRQRAAEPAGSAGLDLADDDGVGRPRDEVEFAEAVPPVAGQDLHPVVLEMRGGEVLAEPPELMRSEPSEVDRLCGRCSLW